ncbi:MAG: GxxExxY protein [Candidatus Omnitrophica bacterium]|nr:GxxExxY protein [Candidatus Omnitrophota bacterium]
MGKLLYEKESYEIRGACFAVWKEFGSAFKETVIEKALAKEFKERGLSIDRQKRIDIFYRDEKVGVYIPDFVIDNKIIIEIKVKPVLIQEDRRQFWHYLKGSHYRLGFLVNFGTKKLEIVRRVYDSARTRYQRISA